MELTVPLKLILGFVLGAVIGAERQINEKQETRKSKPTAVLGLRSFSLIAAMGTVSGLLYNDFLALSLFIAISFGVLSITFYVIDTLQTKNTGITTEIAMFFTFILGALIALEPFPIQITLALAVALILLLSQKDQIKSVIGDINKREINAFVSYLVIALLILPFLPNETYSISDIPNAENFLSNFGLDLGKIADIELVNPFKLWLVVALITGVDLLGYILERTFGAKKGWLVASAAGGFISSTATTQSLAQQSKESKTVNHLLSAAIIANLVSFFSVAIVVGAVNMTYLVKLIPTLLILAATALGITIYFLRKKEGKSREEAKLKQGGKIVELGPALKFAGIYLLISIFSKIALELFGSSGFLIATAAGSLAGLDAVMINTASLAGKSVNFQLAVTAFIIANAVNLIGKTVYSFIQGKREFAVRFGISVGILIFFSLFGLFFV